MTTTSPLSFVRGIRRTILETYEGKPANDPLALKPESAALTDTGLIAVHVAFWAQDLVSAVTRSRRFAAAHRLRALLEGRHMPMRARISVDEEALAALCERHHIRRLALFGSVLREDFRPDSDVDVLVEFEPGQVPGFAFIAVQDELAELLGRRVDLHTAASLSRHIRNGVARDAEVHYVAAARA